ncbi:hypothetical protein [Streptomyces sp. NPDC002587]
MAGMIEHHTRDSACNRPQDTGGTVLDWYLEDLHKRVGPQCFEVLVRAVQDACRRLSDDGQVCVDVPGEDCWTPTLQHEFLLLLAVLITGRPDHHLIERPRPGPSTCWLVVQADTAPLPPAAPTHNDSTGEPMRAASGLERGLLPAKATA